MSRNGREPAGIFRHVTDVAAWRLCMGCGACVSGCPEHKLEMHDFLRDGLRPVLKGSACISCSTCVSVCPGLGVEKGREESVGHPIKSLSSGWGTVIEVWEGHAGEQSVRFEGSSGGCASALALYCIERGGFYGVVHVGSDPVVRFRNKSIFSTTRAEVLGGVGSRYAPASPCDNLEAVADSPGPVVFVGKPCDIEGLRKVEALRPEVAKNVGLAISIFCAGAPSTQGTLDLLARYGIDPRNVAAVRYRGRGWPGCFAVQLEGSSEWKDVASYEDAWGFLEAYRPYRCFLCPDGTGELADISCGDPWYKTNEEGGQGSSLVLVRTATGREIVRGAITAGYVRLHPVGPEVIGRSQRALRVKRGAIWGRILTLRMMGVPAPRLHGFHLFANWLRIPLKDKLRSIFGTARRVADRRYRTPAVIGNEKEG